MSATSTTHNPQPTIVGFVPTPLTIDDTIDAARLEVLAAHLSRFDIQPAVLGGMGEFYALNRAESRICMEAAVVGAAGRVPAVSGVGFATREAIELACDAAEVGITTIVINPPHHAAPSPSAYAEHVRHITEASGLPAILYSSSKYPLTNAHLDALVHIPGFAGVKEEHYSVADAAQRIALYGDRIQWWGVGEVGGIPYLEVGAQVITTSLANFSPGLARDYINQALDGAVDLRIQAAADKWTQLLSSDSEGSAPFLKQVMHQTCGWDPRVRLPLQTSQPQIADQVAAFVAEHEDVRNLADSR